MNRNIIYIPVFLMILIQFIDRKGEYRIYQIILLIITLVLGIVIWKNRKP